MRRFIVRVKAKSFATMHNRLSVFLLTCQREGEVVMGHRIRPQCQRLLKAFHGFVELVLQG